MNNVDKMIKIMADIVLFEQECISLGSMDVWSHTRKAYDTQKEVMNNVKMQLIATIAEFVNPGNS